MADNYLDIMKEIGCGDGFHLPIANEENKIIENEIKELLRKKAKLLLLDESLDDDLQENKSIIKNLSTQEAQNQKLIVANRNQYEMEEQLLIAAQRENEHLSRENKIATKQFNELIDHQTKLENELTKNEEHINKLKETIEWGEESLKAWNNDLAKQDTDVNILEKYNLEDSNMFKDLEVQRKSLQRNMLERESIVEQEINELQRAQRELEQTTTLTRRAQNERNRLIEQWENAAKFLDCNQKEIQHLVQKINKIKLESREIYNSIKENKLNYQNYCDANEQLENEISNLQKINNDLELSNSNQLSENENIQSQVLTAQIALNVLGNKLSNERTKRRHMQTEQEKFKTQIQQKNIDIEKLKDNILKIKNQSMTQEEKINELYKIQDNQKTKTEQLQSEKNKVLNMTFNVKTEIAQLHTRIDLLTNQLNLNRKEQTELRKEEFRMKQSIMKSKEESYNLSFRLETIRTKMSEAKGTVDVNEMEHLQEVLQMVNEELTQTMNEQIQLKKQLKSAESEFRSITKEIERNTVELERYKNRVEELSILNEGGEKQIQMLEEQCHRSRMDDEIMKIKIEQIEKMMGNECEKVYSLAQQREEINADINRRKAEVAITLERINDEKKLLTVKKSLTKRKLDGLIQYIEQRKNKYEILMATVGNSETVCDDVGDDDQTSFTLSKHRIRLAREKLELQDIGDKLDERLQTLETNIRAMENTLLVLNVTNSCYKAGLNSSHSLDDKEKDIAVLEETYDNLKKICSQKKKTIENLENEIQILKYQHQNKLEELDNLNALWSVKNSELEHALKEINEQMIKLNRANSRIQLAVKQIDKSYDPDNRRAFDLKKRDIIVRMMKKVNKSVLDHLSEMSVRYIEVELIVKQYLSERNLELPPVSSLIMNQIKSFSNLSIAETSKSCNTSIKSYSDENRNSSYSVVNLDHPTIVRARKSPSTSMSFVKK